METRITLPKAVEKIIQIFEEKGYEAYAVGGCVRDSLLGIRPKDWDITTSAKPEEIKDLFERTIDTGIQHGTVTVRMDHESYEVTTYRIDGDYTDGRHPDKVTFTENLVEDLKRRDFTINAMAYNNRVGLVDVFEGEEDLKREVIRCVGDPLERFTEDALRILRAIRFSAQLGFEIQKDTYEAIKKLKKNLKFVSAERIRVELEKTICSSEPTKLRYYYTTGVSKVIMPWFDKMMKCQQNCPFHTMTVGEHTLAVLKNIENTKVLRFAALFHDMAKPDCKTTDENGVDHFSGHQLIGSRQCIQVMKDLRFDNKTLRAVSSLVAVHDFRIKENPAAVRMAIHKIGPDLFEDYLKLREADCSGKSIFAREINYKELEYVKEEYKNILERKECLSLKELAISGSDLKNEGLAQGKLIGDVLAELLDQVLLEPGLNTREILFRLAKEYINKQNSENDV